MSFKHILAFALGAAVGTAASWRILKVKYEQIAQEEIDSVKGYYSEKYAQNIRNEETQTEEEANSANDAENKLDKKYSDYSTVLDENQYSRASYKVEKKTTGIPGEAPYVIAPEEFGEMDGYSTISITYYADRVLADDADHIINDVDDTVGFDSLTHFGEYEDDSVFVRNDRRKCDYEILLSQRKYSEILKEKPYLRSGIR